MTTKISPLPLALTTLIAATAFGCDEANTDTTFEAEAQSEAQADLETELLAQLEPEARYPSSEDTLEQLPPAMTDLAAPEDAGETLPVVEHYLYPGQPGWIPTCILGTRICVTNSNGSYANYLANLSLAGVNANSTVCNDWYYNPPGSGGFVSNAAWSPGPLSFSTSCTSWF